MTDTHNTISDDGPQDLLPPTITPYDPQHERVSLLAHANDTRGAQDGQSKWFERILDSVTCDCSGQKMITGVMLSIPLVILIEFILVYFCRGLPEWAVLLCLLGGSGCIAVGGVIYFISKSEYSHVMETEQNQETSTPV